MSACSGTSPGRASSSTAGSVSSAMTLAPRVQQQRDRLADTTGSASDQRDFRDDAMLRIAHADSSGYMAPWAPWLSTGSVLLIVAPRTFAGLLWLSDSCAQKPYPTSADRRTARWWAEVRPAVRLVFDPRHRAAAALTTQPLAFLSWSFACLGHPTPRLASFRPCPGPGHGPLPACRNTADRAANADAGRRAAVQPPFGRSTDRRAGGGGAVAGPCWPVQRRSSAHRAASGAR